MTSGGPTALLGGSGTLALVSRGLGPWRVTSLRLGDDDELTVRFERSPSRDFVEVVVFPLGGARRAFRKLAHVAVAYRGALATESDEMREEVASLVMAVAASIDARMAERPGSTIAEALGRRGERRTVVFGRDALLELLSPDIVEGRPLVAGFRLADVYPTSHLREAASAELRLVMDFRRDEDSRRMLFELGRRSDDLPSLATTPHFSLSHLSLGAPTPPGGDELSALVAFVLGLRDHDGLDVRFPSAAADVARLLSSGSPAEPTDGASERVLNLAIDADCGQACAFCSVKELSPPRDGGDATYARLVADLASNRDRGVRAVRINGYDPLAYSRILDVLGRASELGYERADVFSPCTRLADRAFAERVVAALPPVRRFYVPIYGASAEAHDRVVGTPGAFARLGAALAHLRELVGADGIALIGVATRGGLDGLADAAKWASAQGLSFSAHMPYPSSAAKDDRFFESVPRQRDVAAAMARARTRGARLAVHGVAPCVVLPAMRAEGVALGEWLDLGDASHPLPGTEYRSDRYVHRAAEAGHGAFHTPAVPCPHVAVCALSAACTRELSVAYLEAFGAEEIVPVAIAEIVAK